jgi:hypothetical protein
MKQDDLHRPETLDPWACPAGKMGRTAHVNVRPEVDHPRMDEHGGLHRIEDDLGETWVEDFAAEGVRSIEEYLAKHLAFLLYLEDAPSA